MRSPKLIDCLIDLWDDDSGCDCDPDPDIGFVLCLNRGLGFPKCRFHGKPRTS